MEIISFVLKIRRVFFLFGILPWLQGVPKKLRLGRRIGGLVTDILERMDGPSIKANMRKISVMLIEFYWGLIYLQLCIYEVKKLDVSCL